MFGLNFASKMLNTIMGTEEGEGQQGQGQQGQGQPQQGQQQGGGGGAPSMMGGGGGPMGQQGTRPMGGPQPGAFTPGRQQGPGSGASRQGFPGPPTFRGPTSSPGTRAGPPSFGGPARPSLGGGVGPAHRFNGPQPPQQQQLPPGQSMPTRAQLAQSPIPRTRVPSPGGPPGPPRGPGGPRGPGMSMRGPPPGQHHQFPQRPAEVTAQQPSGATAAPVPEVDLSHLSSEERAMIENVMAKAQQFGEQQQHPGGPQQQIKQRMMRPDGQQQQQPATDGGVKICPLCRQRDVSGKMDGMPGQECADCQLIVCNRCGGMSPHPETKRPEWTCGNCIHNRRQRMGNFPSNPGQGHHPVHGSPSQRAPPYGGQPPPGICTEAGRRGSGGGQPQQQPQQSEREFTTKHDRRPSFEEIFSPEKSDEHSDEIPLHYENPIELDISSYPSSSNPSFSPDHPSSQICMSIPHTASSSASQAKPSSFIISTNNNNKLHNTNRSVSIDMADSRRDSISSRGRSPPPQNNGYDYYSVRETRIEAEPTSQFTQPPPPPFSQQQRQQPPPVPDEKTSALMEELTRLQSDVDSTLKRRQRQQRQLETDEGGQFQPICSRSPSPSPSPTFMERCSSNNISPESPEDVPGPRKAIVLKEHDLDGYKSSSDEEEESGGESDDSDNGGVAPSGDVYYDHSPGEVYTIPEEEDEGGSPTGCDLVTSLKHKGMGFQPTIPGSDMNPRRRVVGIGQDMPHSADPRYHPLRPQLRPQRSLDNSLPSSSPHPIMDQQANQYATNNNVNTQKSLAHSNLHQMDKQGGVNQDIMASSMAHDQQIPIHQQQQGSGMGGVTSCGVMHQQQLHSTDPYHHQPQQQQHPQSELQQTLYQQQILQHRPQFGQQLSHDPQPSIQSQPQQQGQLLLDHQHQQGVGANEWNAVSSQSSTDLCPTAGLTGPSTNQSASSLMQSHPQHLPPNSSFASIPSSSPILSQTSPVPQQQQFATSQQGFPQQTSPVQQLQQGHVMQPHQSHVQQQPQPPSTITGSGGPLQGAQLQQLHAQQAQAQQLAQQQQSWLEQQAQQQQNVYDPVTGRMSAANTTGQYSLGQVPLPHQTDGQYQQSIQQKVNAQGIHPQLGVAASNLVSGHGTVNTSQAGPGAIDGLLADFSKVLGLGTSPRTSPSEDKSLAFPIPPSSLNGMTSQPLSPYDTSQSGIPQSISHQHSAFASTHDSAYQRQNQQLSSYLAQQPSQPSLPSNLDTQFGNAIQSMQQQQQQILENVGAGVIGALSPAQAIMYQQQMAMQHQQQHMKKRSRGSVGDVRRDGQSTVLIGSQGLAGTPTGMTPTGGNSLGTFIGGGSTILGTQLMAGAPVGMPRSGQELPGDSSDTMSETDSQKSLRMRRKLPYLPPDQEAAPLPSAKNRDRNSKSVSPSPMQSTADGVLSGGQQSPFSSLTLARPSASESNLRNLAMSVADPTPRPGSALGLSQASGVVSSMGTKPDVTYPMNMTGSLFSTSGAFPGIRTSIYPTDLTTQTTSVLDGLYPSYKTSQDSWDANLAELAACLPPDLRHLLNKGPGSLEQELSSLSGFSGLGDTGLNSGSQGLPSYIRSLKEQLQEERRQLLSEERRRLELLRERDRELGARLDAVTSRAGSDQGIRTDLGISRSAGASPLLSRKLESQRRELCDPKLSLPFSPIQEDGDISNLQDFDRISGSLLRQPYKSYEYESLADSALLHHRSKQPFDWDHSQSYLWTSAGGVLRETAMNSIELVGMERVQFRSSSGDPSSIPSASYLLRRNSDGETTSYSTARLSSGRDKRRHMRKHRKSRSWHPSSYVSGEKWEEEEDMLRMEDKKASIKAEIARRRQQMQDISGGGGSHLSDYSSHHRDPTDHERHSALKSVEQLIRDKCGRYETPSSTSSSYRGYLNSSHIRHETAILSPCASVEDRSIERIASTFRSPDGRIYYERFGGMSPMATDSESIAAMPILPDMPTRSRRLLEEIGSIGLSGDAGSSGQIMMKDKYGESNQGLGLPYRTVL